MNGAFFGKLFQKKDQAFAYAMIGLLFILFSAMVFYVGYSNEEKETLLMKTEAERAFNSIYMALTENPTTDKATSLMNEEGVIGIGIYSSAGRLVRWLGNVPFVFPYDDFQTETAAGTQSAAYGMYRFNRSSGILQYMRMARLSIDIDAGSLQIDTAGQLKTDLNFPEVLYVVMDAGSYAKALTRIWMLAGAAEALLILVFFIFVRMYLNNVRYREMLTRQESLVSLGAAARTLAHEIKNPLSAMTIQVALLKKVLPEQYSGELAVVDQEIGRLTQLTNKVSDFLRNPVGNPQLIEVRSFIEGLFSLFALPVRFTGDSLGRAYIEFDPDRARSVFENLLKNAMESCAGRDPEVEVEITSGRRGMVSISVLDRGDGLPEGSDQKKVFDPFFTTKIHGSGIGLAITRQFLKARNGTIELSAREGGGTRAEVTLPAVPEKFAAVILAAGHVGSAE